MTENSGTPGAKCALHGDASAHGICARCGNFMCAACTEGGTRENCPTCREVTGADTFPYDRENYSLDGVLSYAWENFKREWVLLSVAILIYFAMLLGIGFVSQIFQIIGKVIDPMVGVAMSIPGQIIQTMVQMVLTAGLALVFWEVFRGRSADLGRLFTPFSRFGTFAVATMVQFGIILGALSLVGIPAGIGYVVGGDTGMAIAGGIALVLMIVPLFWLIIPLSFIPFEVAIGGETSGVQAVKNAFRIADGKRLPMIGFFFISGLITLGGVLVCCVGVLPASALAQMLLFGLFLALRNGSGLSGPRV